MPHRRRPRPITPQGRRTPGKRKSLQPPRPWISTMPARKISILCPVLGRPLRRKSSTTDRIGRWMIWLKPGSRLGRLNVYGQWLRLANHRSTRPVGAPFRTNPLGRPPSGSGGQKNVSPAAVSVAASAGHGRWRLRGVLFMSAGHLVGRSGRVDVSRDSDCPARSRRVSVAPQPCGPGDAVHVETTAQTRWLMTVWPCARL